MNSISKTRIDRLGDHLRKDKVEEDELRQLDDYRRSFAGAYEEVVVTIRNVAQLEPTGRPAKSTTSIIEKLRRETIRLSQMQDIAGCRLVVKDVATQDQVVAQLMAALPSAVLVDRRKQPSYGYRAVHIIATAQGKPVEVQVRTELQHLWAQMSEKLSDLFDPAIKYGGGKPATQEMLSMLTEVIVKVEAMELRLAGRQGSQRDSPDSQLIREKLASIRNDLRQALENGIADLEAASRKQAGDKNDFPD